MTVPTNRNPREGSLTGGIILVGIGLYFLLREFGYLPGLHRFWPLILIIVGVALIAGHLRGPHPGRRQRAVGGQEDRPDM